jgi:hypothetical protein
MHVDDHYRLTRSVPIVRGSASHKTVRDDQDNNLVLRIVVASMPLMGLILGVVALASWYVR